MTSSNLASLVTSKYQAALSSKSVLFTPSTIHRVRKNSITYEIRYCPSLLKKPKPFSPPVSKQSQQQHQHSKPDPFQNPDPSLYIAPIAPSHYTVLNKFPVSPQHFILATEDFKPQSTLELEDFEAILHILKSWSVDNNTNQLIKTKTTLYGFYNCGPVSGASQPHRHIQFLPLDNEDEESKGGTTNGEKLWPGDVTIQQRWKKRQYGTVPHSDGQSQNESAEQSDGIVQIYTHPGFPYSHYIHHFTTVPSSDDSSSSSKILQLNDERNQQRDLTPQRFFDVYKYLLKVAGINQDVNVKQGEQQQEHHEKGEENENKEIDSYNLGFTKDWIVIAKRIKETIYPVKEGTMVNLSEEKDKGKEDSHRDREQITPVGTSRESVDKLQDQTHDDSQDREKSKQDDIKQDKDKNVAAEMVPIPGISVNGTILGGMILTRTDMELNKLMECGDDEWDRLFGGLGVGESVREMKDDSRL